MDTEYMVACGIVWHQTADREAGWELVDALASADPEVRLLAQIFLIETGEDSMQLLESALSTGTVSPETAGECIAEILRKEQVGGACSRVCNKPPVDMSFC